MTRLHYCLVFCLLLGCRPTPAPDLSKLFPRPAAEAPPYPILDPKLFPAVTLAATQPATQPAAQALVDASPAPEPDWQPLDSRRGELDFGSVTLDFIPRSPRWRFRLATDKTPEATTRPGEDHSYVKVSLWMGELDPGGVIGYRAVKVDFRRKGGAGCVQEFTNGTFPDGKPRPFRITISGNFISYAAAVEDLGAK